MSETEQSPSVENFVAQAASGTHQTQRQKYPNLAALTRISGEQLLDLRAMDEGSFSVSAARPWPERRSAQGRFAPLNQLQFW